MTRAIRTGWTRVVSLWTASLVLFAFASAAADEVEFLSGARVEGKVTQIYKEEKKIAFDTVIAGQTYKRVYPYNAIHAVTMSGKKYVLNEKSAASPSGGASGGAANSAGPRRSRADIEALIDQVGSAPPDWYDDTPLNYPPTLDLSWPEKPPKGWNNKKNVGQFNWDIINPNPHRWREGVRLMHYLLTLHKNDTKRRARVMRSLGGMHFRFFKDYARAVYWWRQGRVGINDGEAIRVAECYWRLGNKQMAAQILNQQKYLRLGSIKLWSDMGETDKAIQLAEAYVRAGGEPQPAYLYAGDACRLAGQFDRAMQYYQKAIGAPARRDWEKPAETFKKRARANLEAVRLFEMCDVRKAPDGSYRADSPGYAGPIYVEVVVANGRIEAVKVTQHQEKQFYSALTDTTRQIIEEQGVQGIDATTGATITAEAIINATAKALTGGMK